MYSIEAMNPVNRIGMQILSLGFVLAGLVMTSQSQAQIAITNDTAPALNGATLEDFSSAATGDYASLLLNGVTFTAPGSTVRVQNTYAGSYNTTGNYLDNTTAGAATININFSSPQAVVGFNYGALDVYWQLSAYDISDNLIYSAIVAPNHGSNAGDFIGIGSTSRNITRATFASGTDGDPIFLDNLRTSINPVPEPSTFALAGLGGGLILLLLRRRNI